MRVRDVMTTGCTSITPEATLKEVADMLSERGISGLPVVDEGHRVLGVVSEADILEKERGPKAKPSGFFSWFASLGHEEVAGKLAARTAGEAMTQPALTIEAARPVSEAAAQMTDYHVNRLPVVDTEGKLEGIVTRADLVRAFARNDAEIEREIREDVVVKTLWIPVETVDVTVKRGAVTLAGALREANDVELLPRLVERVPGVVSVTSQLTWGRAGEPSEGKEGDGGDVS